MADVSPVSPSKAQARRQQILDAACDCVRRAGFHGASMAEIAQAAGLSVGQIYRYFENKEAIVAAIVAQDLAEMREKFAEFESADEPFHEVVIGQVSQALDRNYDPNRAALVMEVLAEAARNPRVAAIVRDADKVERELGRTLLKRILGDDRGETELAARSEVLSMLFDGMVSRGINNPDSDRAAISVVLQAVLRLLFTGPPLNEAPSA
ncbi:MAG: TetR/AcrR family transcriptional regulator [Caulobacteraceae bacterium]|nr:TetR/AcrR family transcriptional regulator [Caulobacteraceae bacterium]